MQLIHAYQHFILEEQLFRKEDSLLLALSGGLDSVVLLHLTIASGYRVELAHVNFQLRGEESNRDEAFVKQLASEYDLPIHVMQADAASYALHHKCAIQEAARALRYEWFRALAYEKGLSFILTAHHADDNAETMLMNLFKGTGIAGLRGILPKQDKLVRPILFASRESLEAYAKDHGLAFMTDSSNLTDKYTRNYFRQHIIPMVEQVYPGTQDNLRNNMPRFREAEYLYREAITAKLKKLVTKKGHDIMVPVEKLRRLKPLQTIVFELFHPYGYSAKQIPEIIRFLNASTGSVMLSDSHRLLKNRNWLVLSPQLTQSFDIVPIDASSTEVYFHGGRIMFMQTAGLPLPTTNPLEAFLDANELVYPLLLRPWKQGDYFYPLGMTKKKKLSRFFIDNKLSLIDKEQIWVLESAGRIVWVLGQRIDHRFRITPSTRQVIRIQWLSNR
ncbi:MAG: tRNA lysidine(34) synthetase TilS [Sphingobacteriales bacterium]|nr:MAG: tRNA lysidine(34) synthetase TilS [Sphingobacteriales bacterium]